MPSNASPAAETKPAKQRRAALAPFIAKLGLHKREGVLQRVPSYVVLGDTKIGLDPWERQILQEAFEAPNGGYHPLAQLVAEGLAFQVKCRRQLGFLGLGTGNGSSAANGQPPAVIEQLINDAAIGLAVLEDTQRAINGLIISGEIDSAKKLTGLKNRVNHSVGQLKDCLDPEAYTRRLPTNRSPIRSSLSSSLLDILL